MFAVLLEGIRWQSLAELKLWARFAYNPAEVLMPSHPRLPQTLNLLWLTDGVISPKLTSEAQILSALATLLGQRSLPGRTLSCPSTSTPGGTFTPRRPTASPAGIRRSLRGSSTRGPGEDTWQLSGLRVAGMMHHTTCWRTKVRRIHFCCFCDWEHMMFEKLCGGPFMSSGSENFGQ
jgi:hypothetical protein